MKKIINVTDITAYFYCPRKLWLRMKGIKEPPNRKMILGMLKHRIFDSFNKNEQAIVSSLEKEDKKYIKNAYNSTIQQLTLDIYNSYSRMAAGFEITQEELLKSVGKMMEREVDLRTDSILKVMKTGLRGKELWRELKPKYLTEFEVLSQELGLKGRIDRVEFAETIIPYEIKTRQEIYESDRLQLAAYALLLEQEFGKKIEQAVVEVEDKQENILISKEMKEKVLEIAEKIRNLQEPPFSNNFAKCKDCPLKEECFK